MNCEWKTFPDLASFSAIVFQMRFKFVVKYMMLDIWCWLVCKSDENSICSRLSCARLYFFWLKKIYISALWKIIYYLIDSWVKSNSFLLILSILGYTSSSRPYLWSSGRVSLSKNIWQLKFLFSSFSSLYLFIYTIYAIKVIAFFRIILLKFEAGENRSGWVWRID